MRAEDLRSYIATFRDWLESSAVQELEADHALMLASWREEVAAAERLLEQKPELPIAFLGPSQQGKSSLINAILGENVLPVGGAVGACTCVITSVHHHQACNYRAEIDFISLRDWAEELESIKEAASSEASDEDTDLDREEREALQKSALEKFVAVYRGESICDLPEILNNSHLGLPKEIAFAMSKGIPLVFNEDKVLPLRNKVRRYLVGREQHEEGQFWPLISRVRIYGNFGVLSNGVVLVDLPGLNDPNPAREQVTKKYLEEARHIWLICNSQTGIDRVFTQVLRENAFLLRLFLEGRLDVFSVIATRIDDINLEAILAQQGKDVEEFDGNYGPVLDYRRKEISSHVQANLMAIAEDIVERANDHRFRDSFFDRVRAVPVFAVSTSAYLHAIGRMPLYQGMKLSPEETHLPRLIEHLHSITLENSYKKRVEASFLRLQMLHEQASRFFLDRIRRIKLDDERARKEWSGFIRVADRAIEEGRNALKEIKTRAEESLQRRCSNFRDRLRDLDARATQGLNAIFAAWNGINWRTLHAAVRRQGVWYSASLQREFDFNRDIARAYLDIVQFVWDEFFGTHLAELTDEIVNGCLEELHKTAERLKGAVEMLRNQPLGIYESMEANLRTAGESFQLQAGETRAALSSHIQRTRQALATGMIKAAAAFMKPAYERVAACQGGKGVKKRMLDVLVQHAKQHAPELFISIHDDLIEGIVVLQSSLKR